MKIKAGVSDLSEIIWFAERGADEIYLGFSDMPSHIGRQSYSIKADTADLKKAFADAHKHGSSIYAAVNEINGQDIKAVIEKMYFYFKETSVDGFIVSNPEIPSLWPSDIPVPSWHLSSLAQCFNSYSLKWYKKYGFSRFCVPQHMQIPEISSMFDVNGLETEVFFILNEMCLNIDGLCQGCSGLNEESKLCKKVFDAEGKFFFCRSFPKDFLLEHFFYCSKHCSWLKLVRFNSFDRRKKIFLLAKKLIETADLTNDFNDFKKKTAHLVNDIV